MMIVLIWVFSLMMVIDGKIPIECLKKRNNVPVGLSESLYSELINTPFIDEFLSQKIDLFLPINFYLNRNNAKKSFKKCFNETLAIDQNIANSIDLHINSNIDDYNEIVYNYLSNNKRTILIKQSVDLVIDVLNYDTSNYHGFKFLTYLHDNGKETEKKFNFFLFYSNLLSLKTRDKFSFELLLSNFEEYYSENVKKIDFTSNVPQKEMEVVENRNEDVIQDKREKHQQHNVDDDFTYNLYYQGAEIPFEIDENRHESVFFNNPLNGIYEIPLENDLYAVDNEFIVNEENKIKILHDKFVIESISVTKKLNDIRKNISKLTTMFQSWTPWIDFSQLKRDYFLLPNSLPAEAFQIMSELICDVNATIGTETQNNISDWNFDFILEEINFGFLSITRKKSKESKEVYTAPWSGLSTVNFYKKKKKQYTNESGHPSSNNMMQLKPIQFDLKSMFIWIQKNLNTNNILIGYNIMSELFILIIGSTSNELLKGAKHILYWNCIMYDEEQIARSIHYINLTNMYVTLFFKFVFKIIDVVDKKWAIDLNQNDYIKNTMINLAQMIRTTRISNFERENEFEVLEFVKKVIQHEYRNFIEPLRDTSSVIFVKLNYLIKSLTFMKMYLNALSSK